MENKEDANDNKPNLPQKKRKLKNEDIFKENKKKSKIYY